MGPAGNLLRRKIIVGTTAVSSLALAVGVAGLSPFGAPPGQLAFIEADLPSEQGDETTVVTTGDIGDSDDLDEVVAPGDVVGPPVSIDSEPPERTPETGEAPGATSSTSSESRGSSAAAESAEAKPRPAGASNGSPGSTPPTGSTPTTGTTATTSSKSDQAKSMKPTVPAPDRKRTTSTATPVTVPTTRVTAVPTTRVTAVPTTRVTAVPTTSAPASRETRSGPLVIHRQRDVVIENLTISNPNGDCIKVLDSTRVTIRNSRIGPCSGRAISAHKAVELDVRGVAFEDVGAGVYALESSGVRVNNNTFVDSGFTFVQFDKVRGGRNEINYNRGENHLATSTAVDLVNLFRSHGSATQPITVIGNRFRNGGTARSGSGIMTGDAGGSYQVIRDNVLVNPGQVGIGIASGTNISVTNNRVYSQRLAHANVGIYVWDQYGGPCSGHTVRDNAVNWTNRDGKLTPWWNGRNCGAIAGLDRNNWWATFGPEIFGS